MATAQVGITLTTTSRKGNGEARTKTGSTCPSFNPPEPKALSIQATLGQSLQLICHHHPHHHPPRVYVSPAIGAVVVQIKRFVPEIATRRGNGLFLKVMLIFLLLPELTINWDSCVYSLSFYRWTKIECQSLTFSPKSFGSLSIS